jgi:gliding motility-associated-like protein
LRAQQAECNFGNSYVHPSASKQTAMNFVNMASGILSNNGEVWYTGNFENEGTVNYDLSLAMGPARSRFQGTMAQTIFGSGSTSFYNVAFLGVSYALQQPISIDNVADFETGVLTSQQSTLLSEENQVKMQAGSSWINASDASFVNGFVQKTGNTPFVFPVGNDGHFRPIGIAAPSSPTDIFSARYIHADPATGGYSRGSKAANVGDVSDKEYWCLLRKSGSSAPQVTLTWSGVSASVPTDLSKIQVVRWDGSRWIAEGNVSTSGNAVAGSVTANVTGYGIFSLATVRGRVVAVDDAFSVIQNTTLTGDVSVNDTVSAGANTWTVQTNPLHGDLILQTDGSFTYTPASGYVGIDSFTYVLSDSFGNSDTATVTITVKPLSNYLYFNKQSTIPQLQSDGTFVWKYIITVTNVQPVKIDSIHVDDDLSKVFGSPMTFAVTGITASGNLKANGLYDGLTKTAMLLDVSSVPASGKDSIVVDVKVDPHDYVGAVYNQATFDGITVMTGAIDNLLSDDTTYVDHTLLRRPTITHIPQIELKIPNGFSPNNDGYNDTFVIIHSSDLTLSLEVFNRWGVSVYKNNNYQNDWDGIGSGTLLGSRLLDGTYYYVLHTRSKTTNATAQYAGFITLRR